MPFFGIGLHFIIALFFAIHALRAGRPMYWLFVLFSFPLLGSIVYFFAEYLPSSKVEHGVKQASSKALKLLDPSRALRDARRAFDLTPTVQNRMRLAATLDDAGNYGEAVEQFDACLDGPFANDLEVCFGAAKANMHFNRPLPAILLLEDIRKKQISFRAEELSLLLAKSYAANNDNTHARSEFIHANNTFGSTEARASYAMWAVSTGDIDTAKQLRTELEKDWQHWNKHTRNLHKHLFNDLDSAIASDE